jgi:hypothetical protein
VETKHPLQFRLRNEVKTIVLPEETHVFKLLDEYAKKHYKCFVAEMDLEENRGRYRVCFRPTTEFKGNPDPYLCRYVYLGVEEVKASHAAGNLSNAIIAELGEKLSDM